MNEMLKSNVNVDIFLRLFSKKCIKKNMKIKGYDLEEYLEVLDQILNYEELFSEINNKYQDVMITEKEYDIIKNVIKNLSEKITLCMIVKDEEQCIAKNLESHLPFVDEIIIVDTGSSDNTKNIIKTYQQNNSKIKLFSMVWEDDFSKARNYAKSLATNRWILFLDADEKMDENDIKKLHNIAKVFDMFKYKENLAFVVNAINIEQNIEVTTMQRFFYNSNTINYYGIIHEYIVSNNDFNNFLSIQLNIRIRHYGYKKTVIETKKKNIRNTELLKKMIKLDPDNLRWLYYYTREGIGTVPDNQLIKCIKDKIDVEGIICDNGESLSEYKMEILYNLFSINLKQNEYDECLKILPILEKKYGDNFDMFFYKIYLYFLIYKKEMGLMLIETLKYRKKHFLKSASYIDNNGYHIDLLIAILLYEIGDFKKSKKYLDFLYGKIDISRIFPNMEEIISLLKNY